MLVITLLYLVLFWLLVAWWMRRTRISNLIRNIPMISGQLPIIGIVHRFIGNNSKLWQLIKDVSAETVDLGGISAAWFGPTKVVFAITDPDLSVEVSNACLDKTIIYRWAAVAMGDNIITCNGDLWKSRRKLLNPTFNQNVLNYFLKVFNHQSAKVVNDLLKYVDLGATSDYKAFIANQALETICQTTMGLPEDNIFIDNKYGKALDRLFAILLQRLKLVWLHPYMIYKRTVLKREEDLCSSILTKESTYVLEKSKNLTYGESAELKSRYKTFVEVLLDKGKDSQLSDEEIRHEANAMIAAGYDTSSTTLMQMLVLIGSHEQVQEKIYNELQETFGDTDRDVTKEDLLKLKYLEAVIKEYLRLYPTVPIVLRKLDKDVKIGDLSLPNGADVIFFIYGINRHPCWGADRNEFNPDRWLSHDTLPRNPNAFAAFSVGRRNCIGKTYAMMSLKVSLAHILRKYRLKSDHTKLKFTFEIVLKSIAGDEISIELR